MDFTHVLRELQSASPFDLYRLRAAIDQQLNRPECIDAIRARLHPGMQVSYFDATTNRLLDATVVELNRTWLVVDNLQDGKRWSIRYCTVNLDGVPVDIRSAAANQPLDRSQLQVGEVVGFRDRQNRETYGRILALNQKTASILTNDGERWRVAYVHLFRVMDIVVDVNTTDEPSQALKRLSTG